MKQVEAFWVNALRVMRLNLTVFVKKILAFTL
jgi:hypothetical protein